MTSLDACTSVWTTKPASVRALVASAASQLMTYGTSVMTMPLETVSWTRMPSGTFIMLLPGSGFCEMTTPSATFGSMA